MSRMELGTDPDALYALAPEDFTASRDAAVRAAARAEQGQVATASAAWDAEQAVTRAHEVLEAAEQERGATREAAERARRLAERAVEAVSAAQEAAEQARRELDRLRREP